MNANGERGNRERGTPEPRMNANGERDGVDRKRAGFQNRRVCDGGP